MSKVVKAEYTAEAVPGFNHRTAIEEAARCLLCHDAPCSQGCPAGTDPGKFIRSIRFRNFAGAAETIRSNNVLGGTCARVCPYDRLCEEACSRCGIDKPIEIGKLQRYALEYEDAVGMKTLEAGADKGKKVACIGAGPASLAAATELRKAGYAVTIFDKEEKAGGMLTYGIVPSRLPQEVVDKDIAKVEELGVKFELGKKVSIADVDDYDAVFVGTGLWGTKLPPIPGTDLEGAVPAAAYLKDAKTTGKQDGKKVVVIGGGDVAVDCAVTAKLLGADDVKIVYRRSLEEAPGNMVEFQYALELGVGITTNMAPAEVVGNGKVEAIKFVGREGVLDGSELTIACDKVVFAVGQGAEPVDGVAANAKGGVEADEDGKTNVAKVFAAGDIVNGGKTVVEAVKAGKAAAASIIAYLEKGAK